MSFISRLGWLRRRVCSGHHGRVLAQSAGRAAALTAADYARAEKFMTYNTAPLVLHGGRAARLAPGRCRRPLLVPRDDGEGGRGRARGSGARRRNPPAICRPARRPSARIRRAPARALDATPRRRPTRSAWRSFATGISGCATCATGRETPLTKDGVKDFGYATDNAGWTRSDRPILRWSPDSKKIATFQQDQRSVGEMYLVDTTVGHPSCRRGSTRCPATRP